MTPWGPLSQPLTQRGHESPRPKLYPSGTLKKEGKARSLFPDWLPSSLQVLIPLLSYRILEPSPEEGPSEVGFPGSSLDRRLPEALVIKQRWWKPAEKEEMEWDWSCGGKAFPGNLGMV